MNTLKSPLLVFLLSIACLSVAAGSTKKKQPQARKAPVKVACVGNSITYGTAIEDREYFSYPVQLQEMLGEGYLVGNFGKPGATLLYRGHRPYVRQQEFREAMNYKADVVVMHLGVNDTDPRNWPNYRDEFIKDYRSLVDSFRVANPKARFVIAQLTPIWHSHSRFESGTRDWEWEIQEDIKKVALGVGAQLIDFHKPLYSHPDLFPDGLHPNAEGARILAKTVYEALTGDFGGLSLPIFYTDNMVLQRGKDVIINGKANRSTTVKVTLGNVRRTSVADEHGRWSVNLGELAVGKAVDLTIQNGADVRRFHNVVAGEVWLCSGQSNMEFVLKHCTTAAKDVPLATDKRLRFFNMKANWLTNDYEWPVTALDSVNRLQYYADAKWAECTPQNAADFSGVAYYFGKQLADSLNVPIGLICNAVGGSPTEAWVERKKMEHEFPQILRNWLKNDFVQGWVRGRAAKNIALSKNPLQRHPYEPCYLFEAAIAPLKGCSVKGAIWYQGESNAHNKDAHAKLFRMMTESWRECLGDAKMPIYFVQLSGMERPSWPWFRDSQRLLGEKLSNVGMAVSSDVGHPTDVHPRDKATVGYRLSRLALNKEYGYDHVVPSGPLYKDISVSGSRVVVSFNYGTGLTTQGGEPLKGFEIAGDDGLFYPAETQISGDKVIVWSSQVARPEVVRYGWKPFSDANLINAAGLPASTFRSFTKLKEW